MATIDFTNRVAVITGAGGGLGRTYALDLARRGATVIVNDLGGNIDGKDGSHSMADTVVGEIIAAGGKAIANYDSVASSSGGRAIIEAAMDHCGRVDIVINNAGNLRNAPFEDVSDDLLDSILDVHLKGAFNVTRPAFDIMKKQQYGRIVFTSSAAGIFGNHQQSAYAAAKAGLVGLMNVLSLEGEGFNIHCNALLPTAASRMMAAMDPSMLEGVTKLYQSLGEKMGNTSDPEFVTPLVTFLCSEACNSSHGLYSATLGRYARVYLGLCDGWIGPRDVPPSAEDIQSHFQQICDSSASSEVTSLLGEFEHVRRQLDNL